MRSRVLVGALVAAAVAVTAGSAQAAVYCVPVMTPSCTDARPTLAQAIMAVNANPDADTIILAAGMYSGGGPIFFETHIVGAGQVHTLIEGGSSAAWGVELDHSSSSIQDLTIHEPPGGPFGGLYLAGSAQRVFVDLRDNPVDSSTAVSLHGDGSFTDGSALASLASAHADYGLTISEDGDALVTNIEAQGRYAITTDGTGNKTLRFVRVTGDIYGVQAKAASTLLEDSAVKGPVVSYTGGGATSDIVTTVRHVTVKGGYVGAESNANVAELVASNTAIVGGGTDPESSDIDLTQGGSGTARVEVDYSFFRAGHVTYFPGPGVGHDYVPGSHNINGADAKLVDLAGGDMRPRWDSPLVDAGDPVPGGGEPMADLAGGDRTVNGRTDIGAYEYGRHAPTISLSATPSTVLTGQPVTFSSAVYDPDPNEVSRVTWTFDDGATVTGFTTNHAFATPGVHTVTATATDPAGTTGTAVISVTVSAPLFPHTAMAPTFGFKSLKARKGVVPVVLRCPVIASDCSGTIELRLGRKVLGRARYAIVHGTKRTVKVKLTKGARTRLHKARRGLRIKVLVKPKGAASKSKPVRLTGR